MSEKISMFELLNERMEKEDIVKFVCNYDNKFNELEEENKQLKSQLQQKENIIKEVRKRIHDIWFKIDFTNMTSMSYVTIKLDETSQGNELLEILDKENKHDD